jgi:uncharacterized protein YajQ (UPF0234 family)
MASFDVVSEVDLQEVDNAVNQTLKEMGQRYDFKGSASKLEWDKKELITITGDDDYKLGAVTDILQNKLIKRSISLKSLDYGNIEEISGGLKKQIITVKQGIEKEKAKEIVKSIKNMKIKVQAQIQEDKVRVTGKKIDDLQDVIAELKTKDLGVELQFENMRS